MKKFLSVLLSLSFLFVPFGAKQSLALDKNSNKEDCYRALHESNLDFETFSKYCENQRKPTDKDREKCLLLGTITFLLGILIGKEW